MSLRVDLRLLYCDFNLVFETSDAYQPEKVYKTTCAHFLINEPDIHIYTRSLSVYKPMIKLAVENIFREFLYTETLLILYN